jgi:hypothetical protein
MQFVDTEWIAFLDDDDCISNDYIETFNNELKLYPSVDLIIFRMYRKYDNKIYPSLKTDNFYMGAVGISFVLKTSIFKSGLKFYPSSTEDYNYLDLIRRKKYIIMISPYIKYFVECNVQDDIKNIIGNRVIIHNKFEGFDSSNNIPSLFFLLLIIMFTFPKNK